mmetsp:Transcript_103034/g.315228  ORF Transcript_103034/g.315228 Transcript_103034/m.315228 type:complete len:206 (-) Transcript_103034:524-1141(-)
MPWRFLSATFANSTSTESGKTAMKQNMDTPSKGAPGAAAETNHSWFHPPNFVPFQPFGGATGVSIHVLCLVVCTHADHVLSFTKHEKPWLAQQCVWAQSFPAHEHGAGNAVRFPSASQDQFAWVELASQKFMHVAQNSFFRKHCVPPAPRPALQHFVLPQSSPRAEHVSMAQVLPSHTQCVPGHDSLLLNCPHFAMHLPDENRSQ